MAMHVRSHPSSTPSRSETPTIALRKPIALITPAPKGAISAGAPSGSSNPIVDYHFLYAIALIVLALTYAGSTWGLGKVWARLPFVHRHPWAL